MAEQAKDTIALLEAMPPILAGTADFQPTKLMMRTVWFYVNQTEPGVRKILADAGIKGKGPDDELSMPMIVSGLGHSRTNYYNWLAMPGFTNWRHVTVQSLLGKDSLQRVHLNLAKRAETSNDPAMIKLYLQRFDKDFVPRSATSARHEFAGYEPGDAEEQKRAADNSRRRQREAIATQQGGTVVPPGGFLPENPDEAKTREAER